jgi:hypothetical protein
MNQSRAIVLTDIYFVFLKITHLHLHQRKLKISVYNPHILFLVSHCQCYGPATPIYMFTTYLLHINVPVIAQQANQYFYKKPANVL